MDSLTAKFRGDTNGVVRTAYILQTLRRIVKTDISWPYVERSDNRRVRQQRQDVNHLLSQLLLSDYNGGALEITRLCLLWKDYEHHAAEHVMTQLISIGSRQGWFQSLGTVDYLEPVPMAWSIEFAKKDGKADLAAKLGSLRLQGSDLSGSSTDEENAALATHRKKLAKQTDKLEAAALIAARLATTVAVAIHLQATTYSSHLDTMTRRIAAFTGDQYALLDNTAALVIALRAILVGQIGVIGNEEQPDKATIHRPDIGAILHQIVAEVESAVHLALRFVLQLAGLVGQAKVLYRALESNDDEVLEILMDPQFELCDYAQKLRSELNILLGLIEKPELASFEHPLPTIPPEDQGLRQVYHSEVRLKGKLKGKPDIPE